MIVSYMVGGRDSEYAMALMDDLRGRLANRVQLTTDGHKAYLQAVEEAFGDDIDYAQLIKLYGEAPHPPGRYSPAECIGAKKETITGKPDKAHVSTSYVERSNLSIRMHMRRFTRLTNAHSKKLENHTWAVALHVTFYNFVRMHSTLRMSPAMAAGVSDRLWEMSDIVALIDAREEAPKRPTTYRKRRAAAAEMLCRLSPSATKSQILTASFGLAAVARHGLCRCAGGARGLACGHRGLSNAAAIAAISEPGTAAVRQMPGSGSPGGANMAGDALIMIASAVEITHALGLVAGRSAASARQPARTSSSFAEAAPSPIGRRPCGPSIAISRNLPKCAAISGASAGSQSAAKASRTVAACRGDRRALCAPPRPAPPVGNSPASRMRRSTAFTCGAPRKCGPSVLRKGGSSAEWS
jgi:IS1 family transposase